MERTVKDIQWGDEETDWYGLEIWGQTAEFVSKFVDKGARVGVIGSLQVDEWADKQTGETRSAVKVVVRELDILETREEANARRARRGSSSSNSYGSGGDSNNNNKRRNNYSNDDDDDWPSPAGSGDFF